MSPARRDVNQVAGYPMNRRHAFRVLGMAAVLLLAGCQVRTIKPVAIDSKLILPIPPRPVATARAMSAPPPPVSRVFRLEWECYDFPTNGAAETILESSTDLIHWQPFAAVPIYAVSNSLPVTNAGGCQFFRAFNQAR